MKSQSDVSLVVAAEMHGMDAISLGHVLRWRLQQKQQQQQNQQAQTPSRKETLSARADAKQSAPRIITNWDELLAQLQGSVKLNEIVKEAVAGLDGKFSDNVYGEDDDVPRGDHSEATAAHDKLQQRVRDLLDKVTGQPEHGENVYDPQENVYDPHQPQHQQEVPTKKLNIQQNQAAKPTTIRKMVRITPEDLEGGGSNQKKKQTKPNDGQTDTAEKRDHVRKDSATWLADRVSTAIANLLDADWENEDFGNEEQHEGLHTLLRFDIKSVKNAKEKAEQEKMKFVVSEKREHGKGSASSDQRNQGEAEKEMSGHTKKKKDAAGDRGGGRRVPLTHR